MSLLLTIFQNLSAEYAVCVWEKYWPDNIIKHKQQTSFQNVIYESRPLSAYNPVSTMFSLSKYTTLNAELVLNMLFFLARIS